MKKFTISLLIFLIANLYYRYDNIFINHDAITIVGEDQRIGITFNLFSNGVYEVQFSQDNKIFRTFKAIKTNPTSNYFTTEMTISRGCIISGKNYFRLVKKNKKGSDSIISNLIIVNPNVVELEVEQNILSLKVKNPQLKKIIFKFNITPFFIEDLLAYDFKNICSNSEGKISCDISALSSNIYLFSTKLDNNNSKIYCTLFNKE